MTLGAVRAQAEQDPIVVDQRAVQRRDGVFQTPARGTIPVTTMIVAVTVGQGVNHAGKRVMTAIIFRSTFCYFFGDAFR